MYDRIETAFIKDLCERCIIDIHLDALDRRILRQVLTAARAEVVEYRHLLALDQQFPQVEPDPAPPVTKIFNAKSLSLCNVHAIRFETAVRIFL